MAGTDVATTNSGGLLARYAQGDNPFLADAGNDEFFGSFLKFNGNTGDYLYGDDYAEEIPHGSVLLANLENALHGWICWVDGEVMDEVNVLISSGKPLPKESTLEDYGPYETHSDGTKDGWSEQYVIPLYWEKTDEAFTLKLSSKSGLRAAKQLIRTFGKSFSIKIGDDGEIQVPAIEIGSTSFDVKKEDGSINKKAGKKHAPAFKIVEWVDKSEVAEFFEASGGDDAGDYDGDDDEQDAPPARGGRGGGRDKDEAPARGRGRPAPADDEDDAPPARGRGRGREAAPADDDDAPPARGRGRGREAAPADDEADEPPARGRGRGREAAPADDDDAPPARGRGRGREAAPADDDDAGDAADEAPATGGGRRARVMHAEPQDDEGDDAPAASGRDSARGRRGRARD